MGDVIRRGTRDQPFFYIRFFDLDGRRKMRAAPGARTKAEARVQLAEAETRVRGGKPAIEPHRPAERRTGLTVEGLGDRFVAEYSSPKLKNPAEYRAEAKSVWKMRITPALGKRPAASLILLDVERMRDALVTDGYSKASATQAIASLSKAYEWGRKLGLVDCANPCRGVERFKGEDSIDYLSRNEVIALLAHAAEHAPSVYPMIATAIYCGLRKGELFGLRWTDVHLDRAQLTVERSYTTKPKSGKRRHLALNPALVRVLREWKKRCPVTDDGLVFPVRDGDGQRMGKSYDMLGLAVLLKAAGSQVPDKEWHALRHTFASHYMMAGGSILELQRLLGHHSVTQTEKYAHLAPDHLAAGIARMSFEPPIPADVDNLDEAHEHAARRQP